MVRDNAQNALCNRVIREKKIFDIRVYVVWMNVMGREIIDRRQNIYYEFIKELEYHTVQHYHSNSLLNYTSVVFCFILALYLSSYTHQNNDCYQH